MIDPQKKPKSSQFRYVIALAAHEEQSDALRSICIFLHGKDICQKERSSLRYEIAKQDAHNYKLSISVVRDN